MRKTGRCGSWCGAPALLLLLVLTAACEGDDAAGGGGGGTADLGFRPTPHGFSFENYGNEDGARNLTPAQVHHLFGDAACAWFDGDACALTPAARQWMEQNNAEMDGGHCEGMAVLSLFFYLGIEDPTEYGAGTAWELPDESDVQSAIAYWFVTQGTEPTVSAEIVGAPSEIVERLEASFADGGRSESYTLGLYDAAGGHAVTPYRVDRPDAETARIAIYDNNHPGRELYVDVDLVTDSWRYVARLNPDEPEEEWSGDAASETLTLTPTSARLEPQRCPFCGNLDEWETEGALTAVLPRQVWLEGPGRLLLEDDRGGRIGFDGDLFVETMEGARAVRLRYGFDVEPFYEVPGDRPLTVTLDGASLDQSGESEVSLIGPGYTMGVTDIALDPDQKDTVMFSADWKEITYVTDADETPILELGFSTTAADYAFFVVAAGDAEGQRVDLALDLEAQTLVVLFTAAEGATEYGIGMVRLDDRGEQFFLHVGGTLDDADDALVLLYGDWAGDGEPLLLGIDRGADGTIDEERELEDVGNDIDEFLGEEW